MFFIYEIGYEIEADAEATTHTALEVLKICAECDGPVEAKRE